MAVANVQTIINLSMDYFRRNNPVEQFLNSILTGINNLVTLRSKMKLLKYKYMLAQEQLNKMEHHIQTGSPYDIKGGGKINRAF
ncbi:MAG: hypothetical protein KTR14_05085 [Vampirovibrio sp.]|nr:hypothetical protein [Vampirovibrio sp.]